ncbi:unnamed protein product, partial [Arabidopsis halleri]
FSCGLQYYSGKRSRRKRDDHGTIMVLETSIKITVMMLATSFSLREMTTLKMKNKGEKSRDKYREDKEEDIKQKGCIFSSLRDMSSAKLAMFMCQSVGHILSIFKKKIMFFLV